jgi:hypothetical protein
LDKAAGPYFSLAEKFVPARLFFGQCPLSNPALLGINKKTCRSKPINFYHWVIITHISTDD